MLVYEASCSPAYVRYLVKAKTPEARCLGGLFVVRVSALLVSVVRQRLILDHSGIGPQ